MVEIAILDESGLKETEIAVYLFVRQHCIHTCNSPFSVQGDPLYTFVVLQHFVLYSTFVIDPYIYSTGMCSILSMQIFLPASVNGWLYLNIIKYFDMRMVRETQSSPETIKYAAFQRNIFG